MSANRPLSIGLLLLAALALVAAPFVAYPVFLMKLL